MEREERRRGEKEEQTAGGAIDSEKGLKGGTHFYHDYSLLP